LLPIVRLRTVIERKIDAALDDEAAQARDILLSMPGVGPVLASTLLIDLPEIGCVSARRIAALAGVAPINRDSGARRGQRCIWGGRREVRHAPYNASRSAIRHTPIFKSFYERLRQEGKHHMVAVVAVMRKMLITLNAMIKTRTSFQAKHGCC